MRKEASAIKKDMHSFISFLQDTLMDSEDSVQM